MVTFSNPRLTAEFTDWPLGGNKRGTCRFWIESRKRHGYRFVRQTTGKPKTATYGGQGAIVDGSDGRTYLIQLAGVFDFIRVWRPDFMSAGEEVTGGSSGSVFAESPRYAELKALIDEANHDKQLPRTF